MKKKETPEEKIGKRIFNLSALRRKERVLKLASIGKDGLGLVGNQWDANPYLLGCPNGVIDLKTGIRSDGRPDQFIKTVCPTPFDPNAPPPEMFLDALRQIFNNDDSVIKYTQHLFGYSLLGKAIENVLVIFWGPKGQNGKGTLLEAITFVLGPLAGAVSTELVMQQMFTKSSSAPSPDVLDLRGKRLVWGYEIEKDRKIDSAQAKRISSHETLNARALYGRDIIRFTPSHTFFLATNDMPKWDASDNALNHRIHLVPFKISFVDEPDPDNPNQKKAIKNFDSILQKEAQGILKWLVDGCLEYQKIGYLKRPSELAQLINDHRKEQDIYGQYIQERVIAKYGNKIRSREFCEDYVFWCKDQGIEPETETSFCQEMHKRFSDPTKKKPRDGGGIYFKDIAFKEECISNHSELAN